MSLLLLNAFRSVEKRLFSIRLAYLTDKDAGNIVGTGGSTRDGGGVTGDREAAGENAYFRKLETEQLQALAKMHDEEIKQNEKEIKRHQKSIEKHCHLKDNLIKKHSN